MKCFLVLTTLIFSSPRDISSDPHRAVIASSLVYMIETYPELMDSKALLIDHCDILVLANEFIEMGSKINTLKHKICAFDKGILFQLGIERYFEITQIQVDGESALVNLTSFQSLGVPDLYFELDLVKEKDVWKVDHVNRKQGP